MTPALRLLKKNKIEYAIHEYEHDPNVSNFGLEAANKLNLPAEQIFKTLLVALNGDNKNLAVMILPVSSTLDLKHSASVLRVKKICLADKEVAQKTTGYIIGGISPLGQKKVLPTYIDSSALNFTTILVSAGRRGLDIELAPAVFETLLKAQFVKITQNS